MDNPNERLIARARAAGVMPAEQGRREIASARAFFHEPEDRPTATTVYGLFGLCEIHPTAIMQCRSRETPNESGGVDSTLENFCPQCERDTEQAENLEIFEILSWITAKNPLVTEAFSNMGSPDRVKVCLFCRADNYNTGVVVHREGCVWVRARKLLGVES